jgi:hypothetical protein
MSKSFNSIGAFIEHLERIAATAQLTANRGLHNATEMVWEESRHSIGEYQEAAGPFKEWADLADSTLEGSTGPHGEHYPGKIELGYAPPDNPLLRTGELRDAIEFAVTSNKGVVGVPSGTVGNGTEEDPTRDIGDVAVDHELGTRNMPARSFLGRALFVKTKEVVATIGHAVILGLEGKPFEPIHRSYPGDDIPF